MEVEIGRGKKGRRAYGFDDIAIVPSRRTRDAEDVDITWRLGPHTLAAAAARLGHGRRRRPRLGRHDGQARRARRAQSRGRPDPLRERRRAARPHRLAAQRDGDADACRRSTRSRSRTSWSASASRRSRTAACWRPPRSRRSASSSTTDGTRGRPRRARHPGHRDQCRARLDQGRAAQPQGVHRRLSRCPSIVGGVASYLDHAAPHAHRRRRRARRRRSRPRLHHARRARHRRAAGDGDRRRRRRPHPAPARDGRATAT